MRAKTLVGHRRRPTPYRSSIHAATALWLLLLLFLGVVRASETIENDEVVEDMELDDDDHSDELEEEEDSMSDNYEWRRHADLRRSLYIDFDNADDNVDLSTVDANEAASVVMQRLGESVQERLARLFASATSHSCRAKIAEHFGYFVNAIGKEEALPFSDVHFTNECPEPVYDFEHLPENVTLGSLQNRTYQPPRDEAEYIDDPADLRLLYAILTHNDPASTIRLIEQLYQDGYTFVVHVDGKESSDETFRVLVDYAKSRDHVHILQDPLRVRVNWGGFSMVNATMQILRYAFSQDDPSRPPLEFHKFIHLASTSYPTASNTEIRHKLASYPLDANFFNVIMTPTHPLPHGWHYFVECDDALHRIHHLPVLQNATAGCEVFTASQWFIISREFAEYMAKAEPGTFVHQFLEYAEHIVVADESFFGTVLRNTAYCLKHVNNNFLHLQFDRYESDLPEGQRDEKKCMMKDPDRCGRSPTTMTVDYIDILELTEDLFARKFVDSVDSQAKDIVDAWRTKREEAFKSWNRTEPIPAPAGLDLSFEGHGVLIVAKDTVTNDVPLCLGIGETGNKAKLVPCFHEWVPPILEVGWETGGVIREEAFPHNRWEFGPCTTDGALNRLPSAEMKVTLGNYSRIGPRCMLKQGDGLRAGRCFDTETNDGLQPGGEAQVYPCIDRWYQFLSFGDGRHAPKGSLVSTIPIHIVRQIHNLGHQQYQHLCLGVYGRGEHDEEEWEDDDDLRNGKDNDQSEFDIHSAELPSFDNGDTEWADLSEWEDEQIYMTQCTNAGAVIEWLFVPFIVEEDDEGEEL